MFAREKREVHHACVYSRAEATINRGSVPAQNKEIVSSHRSLSTTDGTINNYPRHNIEGTFDGKVRWTKSSSRRSQNNRTKKGAGRERVNSEIHQREGRSWITSLQPRLGRHHPSTNGASETQLFSISAGLASYLSPIGGYFREKMLRQIAVSKSRRSRAVNSNAYGTEWSGMERNGPRSPARSRAWCTILGAYMCDK